MTENVWAEWAERWRLFQESYVPQRQQMLETLAGYVHSSSGSTPARVLDLCCGPGSVADTILRELPSATATALDCDPWLLELGRRTAASRSRITWVEGDLRHPRWAETVPAGPYDAVTLVTALPWLDDDVLCAAFRTAASLLAPEGVVLLADELPTGAPSIQKLTEHALRAWQAGGQATRRVEWHSFWGGAATVPAFRELLEERDRRMAPRRPSPVRTADLLHQMLATAGLGDSGEIWRLHHVAVIAAQKGARVQL
jgi:trans-aconitate methyltransferase